MTNGLLVGVQLVRLILALLTGRFVRSIFDLLLNFDVLVLVGQLVARSLAEHPVQIDRPMILNHRSAALFGLSKRIDKLVKLLQKRFVVRSTALYPVVLSAIHRRHQRVQ